MDQVHLLLQRRHVVRNILPRLGSYHPNHVGAGWDYHREVVWGPDTCLPRKLGLVMEAGESGMSRSFQVL
jgi:hypothetical protein